MLVLKPNLTPFGGQLRIREMHIANVGYHTQISTDLEYSRENNIENEQNAQYWCK